MRPTIATINRSGCSAPRWAVRSRSCSEFRTSCPVAAPVQTPRRLTVIVGGKATVIKESDSCYIGPNEIREIINRGNEVCTIAVAVAPVK
jgi:hypothetical protein